MPKSEVIPLSLPWITEHRSGIEFGLSEVQRIALSSAWNALEDWLEQRPPPRVHQLASLAARGIPLLEKIREGVDVDDAIAAFVHLVRTG